MFAPNRSPRNAIREVIIKERMPVEFIDDYNLYALAMLDEDDYSAFWNFM